MDEREKEEELRQEIDEFNREKERIKQLIGRVGGTSYSHKDNIFNTILLIVVGLVFILEITAYFVPAFHFLPSFISIEVSVLLVSIKIVWMIHSQHKYNHFVFWILNTIEFRLNDLGKTTKALNKKLEE